MAMDKDLLTGLYDDLYTAGKKSLKDLRKTADDVMKTADDVRKNVKKAREEKIPDISFQINVNAGSKTPETDGVADAVNQSGKTILHVTFDGESEVNDYMDTQGALMVKYAVEKKAPGSKTKIIYSHTKTGDPMNLLLIIALMSAALLIAILAILSWKRERREEGDEA